MNGKMRKKIMAILLSGVICISNCSVQVFADEIVSNSNVESDTYDENEYISTDTAEEDTQENMDYTETEQESESETIVYEDTEEESESEDEFEENTEELLMALADTGTFSSLDELKGFYEANQSSGGLKNALDFTNYNKKTIGSNANGLILLSCVENESFEGYTIKLSGLSGGGSNLAAQIDGFPDYTFKGLGRSDNPFKGTITVSDSTTVTYIDLTLDRPFFNSIDVTSAKIENITTINIITASESVVAFAQEVYGTAQSGAWANIEVSIEAYKHVDGESVTFTYPGPCIGSVKAGTVFSIGGISYNSKAIVNSQSGHAGLLCNEIESKGSFQVTNVQVSNEISVTSGNNAAGGLVGYMADGASLSVGFVNETPSEEEVTVEEETIEVPETISEEQTTEEAETISEEQTTEEVETISEEQTTEEPETISEEQTTEESETISEEQTTVEPETIIADETTVKTETTTETENTEELMLFSEIENVSEGERTFKLVIGDNWTITGKNAGGLIGEATNAILKLDVEVSGAKVISNVNEGSSGGLIGAYHLTSNSAFNTYDGINGTIQMTNVVLDATGSNSYCGGLFGVLELSQNFSISNISNIQSTAGIPRNDGKYNLNSSASYGGLVGQVYGTDSSTNLFALTLDGLITAQSTLKSDITYYGGLIGVIGKPGIDSANNNGAYVVSKGQTSTICNGSNLIVANSHYFGGAVGGMFYHSVFEIAEKSAFSPTAVNIKYGGGIVGAAARGSTLRLAGTTDLTGITFVAQALGQNPGSETNNRNSNGQIAGIQNAAVIYATKSWTLIRPTNPGEIDDIGNYGSVIRLGRNIGQGSETLGVDGGLSENLISQDPTTHKTIFGTAATLDKGVIQIGNADQFALLSIAEQTYGDFGIYPTVTSGFIIGNNKVTKIVLTANIDLSNTGISGFQRDFYNGNNVYTGELDGSNHTLTLDIGHLYANNGEGAGNGQIHGHSQVGLFSQANATIKNLTINGNINVRERTLNTTDAKQTTSMAVGACVALSTESESTFANVTTNVNIQCAGAGTESVIGGLLGLKQGSDSAVTVTNCTGKATIKDDTTTGVHTVGGLIGMYTGGGTIDVSGIILSGSIKGNEIADAKYGGLISVIKDNSATMNVNNLTVEDQKIENGATISSGGLLGYEWNNCEVFFGVDSSPGVTVQGNSTVLVNGNASLGALVYQATGYWQVNGISLNKVSIQNKSGDLGLLICHGRKSQDVDNKQKGQLLYLEETKKDGYHIDDNVTVSSTGGFFDEWIVYTAESAETITDNGNSVISIATEGKADGTREGFDPTESISTGYQNRTKNGNVDWSDKNPNARYYYDLDVIREEAKNVDGYVNTPGEVVLWSVWRYCEKVQDSSGGLVDSNIQKYFKTTDIADATFDGENGNIDLTGYSYYPVNVDAADVQIQNCTIVFANKIIESAEKITASGMDSMIRTTVGTNTEHTQHYLMHSGLILNYKNTSTKTETVTLSVSNVTLKGTVGKGENETGSGAIICGTVEGSSLGGSHFAKVKLNNVTLDKLVVNSDTESEDAYAPLLINTVGSYGGIDAQIISTANYDSSEKAATSLIGHVGDKNATNISLAFSNNIDLNGRTEYSIFSHATLLESFQYSGASSSGYYHFKENEEFTYGREINGTRENKGKQLYYFGSTNPIMDGTNSNFNTAAYLPYVCQTKVKYPDKEDTFHELEINITKPDLDEGCGTYDDPYIIKQPAQLELVAQYIAGTTTAGWKINRVIDATIIKSDADLNHKLYEFSDKIWKNSDPNESVISYSEKEMRDYLKNAYYKIEISANDDFVLNNFAGLGTATDPFRGVIDGGNNSVTVNAEKITSGFINVSYGSVIQNMTINYKGQKILSDKKAKLNSNTVENESYFGGIIGNVKGGDNLITNVKVNYSNDFHITVQNHLQCVGGFFGIVEGGGVILSKMYEESEQPAGLKNHQISTSLEEKDRAYISPLVGRVLDGFVINETTTTGTAFEASAGPDKNYSIGNVLSTASLDVNTSGSNVEVKIDQAEELLLFSAMINSGACNGGWSLAYKTGTDANAYKANSGKVRNADYSQIGNVNAGNKSQYFDSSRNDDTNYPAATNLPYIIKKYARGNSVFWNLCLSGSNYLDLSIQRNLDMSGYKNGYRGIGGRYNCTASSSTIKDSTNENQITNSQFQSNTPVFVAIDGGSNTLTVDNQMNGYSDDNYVANAAGGLVNVLRRKANTLVTVQNLTVKGNVELHDFSDQLTSTAAANASDRNYASSVGGVIGRYFTEETAAATDTYLELNNLIADSLTLYSDGATGGIVGQTGAKKFFVFENARQQYASGVTYMDCSYSNLKAVSCQSTGGIVGAACDNPSSYYYNGNVNNNDTKVTNKIVVSHEHANTGYNSTLSVYASPVSGNGLGGLIGNVGSNVEINKDGAFPLILDKITLQDSNVKGVSRTGGAIGFLHHGTTKAYNITVSNSTLGNGQEDNLGGIVGCWFSNAAGGIMENIVIDNCSLNALDSVGGVIGYISNAKNIKNITVKNTTIKQTGNKPSRGVAMVVGQIYTGGIYGENILLKDNNIICTSTASKGRIVGKVDSSQDLPIQLLGVSVQYGKDANGNSLDASQPPEDIGSIPYKDYANKTNKIFISYDAFLTEKDVGSELAQWPYVEIPGVGFEETVGTNTTYKITSDTAKPYTITGSDSVTGIVKKEGNAYSYIGSKKTYQYVNTANVDRLVPGIVSTYNANQDTKIEKNFDVIQIDGSAACLKQYLNAATNGAFATGVAIDGQETDTSKKVMTVDVSRYKWDSSENKFVKDATAKPTLVYDSTDGSFYATAQYDNQNNMFTLVSVTFKTTANNYTRTYHIPVIVRRMLQVDFMATMVSGTVFNASEMEGYKTHALASAGEEITGYLTFKYNSNLSGIPATYDWQSYMEGGANLLGYYQKTMDTGSANLPAGTQITLIDCQQSERRYYAVVPEGGSQLELFSGNNLKFTHSDGTAYQPVKLAELLKIEATRITDSAFDGTKWVILTEENKDEATVVDNRGNYYRLYDANKDKGLDVMDCFTLTITDTAPQENYFVVISVPNAENHMLTLIKSGGVTKGSFAWSDTEASAPPTEIHQLHRYKDENTGKYTQVSTNASSEITFNFLNNYTQELRDLLSVETFPVTSTGSSTVEMSFELQNTVTFEPANYEKSDPLYQELRVSLRKTTDGVGTDVYFPSDTTATVALYAYYIKDDQKVYFEVDENGKLKKTTTMDPDHPPVAISYDWLAGNDGNMVLPFAVKKDDGTYQYVDLSPIRIASESQKSFYIEAKLQKPISIGINSIITNDMLPVRENEGSRNQTNMYFTSVLSFKESGLSYSTLRNSATGSKGYYLKDKREAVLKLDYLNVDQLGINLSDEHSGEINAMLTLDFSGAEGFNTNLSKFAALNDADSVVFDFSLKQKGQSELSSEDYGGMYIGDYLTGISITGGQSVNDFKLEVSKNAEGSYPYYNETSGVFSIPVTFKVNTINVAQYANYRIYASVDIMKDGQPKASAINAENAFITYTIAKININGIWSKPKENP
ncbi:MAG: hypothetical protein SO181_03570 [Frisingicoccus sp.]|uniref:hypothetical protein n=1 Tax=Frisingicoccus sp. TaxID=1918627 RepID=UPI002A819C0F|nr:hypothetical protein [Frisingicoccus sp.]MDY4834213.1 hypothetical protein [Frisingicoccus sp.]